MGGSRNCTGEDPRRRFSFRFLSDTEIDRRLDAKRGAHYFTYRKPGIVTARSWLCTRVAGGHVLGFSLFGKFMTVETHAAVRMSHGPKSTQRMCNAALNPLRGGGTQGADAMQTAGELIRESAILLPAEKDYDRENHPARKESRASKLRNDNYLCVSSGISFSRSASCRFCSCGVKSSP